jgi:hypothetical protein
MKVGMAHKSGYRFFDVCYWDNHSNSRGDMCTNSQHQKEKGCLCVMPGSKNILETAEKSPQQQFQRQHENKCSCNLMRVDHKVADYALHHE